MSKILPYLRWYPADAESDSKYASMSLAELGLYHRCLNHSWLNDGLPPDPAEIGRVLRVSAIEIKRHWPRVSQCFVVDVDRLRNPRQEDERTYAIEKSDKATNAVLKRYGRSTSVPTAVGTDDLPRAYGCVSGSDSSSVLLKKIKVESEEWFEQEFWSIWPVNENKPPAKKAASKVKPEERAAVVAGVIAWSGRILGMERPIHASTWINGRRWEDAVPLFKPPTSTDRKLPPAANNGHHKREVNPEDAERLLFEADRMLLEFEGK